MLQKGPESLPEATFMKNRALGISVLKLQVLKIYHISFLAIKLSKESLSFRDFPEKTENNVNAYCHLSAITELRYYNSLFLLLHGQCTS
jgi:hypothetical protein